MKDIKQYFLGDDVNIALGIDRPKEEQKFYYDNVPSITLHSMSNYVMLAIITEDDNTSRRILLTTNQARDLARILPKYLKKFAKKIKKGG